MTGVQTCALPDLLQNCEGRASTIVGDAFRLAIDSAGNLYASINTGNNNNRIERFSPSGADLGAFASGLNGACGLAFDSAGNLYAAVVNNNTIEKFTPGGIGSVFASTGLDGPYGLVFDSVGNLYAANLYNSTIEKFSPSGADLGVFAATGVNAPYSIAIQMVPEPSTWAMLGLGTAALMIYRRRRYSSLFFCRFLPYSLSTCLVATTTSLDFHALGKG